MGGAALSAVWGEGAREVSVPALGTPLPLRPCHPGETGIGKSTLMNTLFNTNFETEEASHHEACVRLRPQTYDLQESNVHLKLTIVDAVGFGDQINKDERHEAGRAQ